VDKPSAISITTKSPAGEPQLSCYEARRIAANVTKLPELLKKR
jgi:hypothetical protein